MKWSEQSHCVTCKHNFTGFCLQHNDSVNRISKLGDRYHSSSCRYYEGFDVNQSIAERIKERNKYNMLKIEGEDKNVSTKQRITQSIGKVS